MASACDITDVSTQQFHCIKEEVVSEEHLELRTPEEQIKFESGLDHIRVKQESVGVKEEPASILEETQEEPQPESGICRCPICDYKTSCEEAFVTYLPFHVGQQCLECPQCDFVAHHEQILEMHVTKLHLKCKPFKCNACKYATTRKVYLDRHMISHTGQMPYKCSECDFGSVLKRNLQRHIAKTHSKQISAVEAFAGWKLFRCDSCGYKMKVEHFVKTHVGEKPFRCNVCECGTLVEQTCVQCVGNKTSRCSECENRTKKNSVLQQYYKIQRNSRNVTPKLLDYNIDHCTAEQKCRLGDTMKNATNQCTAMQTASVGGAVIPQPPPLTSFSVGTENNLLLHRSVPTMSNTPTEPPPLHWFSRTEPPPLHWFDKSTHRHGSNNSDSAGVSPLVPEKVYIKEEIAENMYLYE